MMLSYTFICYTVQGLKYQAERLMMIVAIIMFLEA